MKKQFKIFAFILALWLALFNPVNISLVYAQEASPTDTPADTSTPAPTVSPTDSPSPTIDPSITTGDATSSADSTTASNISDLSVSPTPSPTPLDSSASNGASPIDNPIATDSGSLMDPDATPSASPTGTPSPSPTDVSVSQGGTTNSDTTSSASSGSNSQTGNSSESATIVTGNAVSSASSITVTNLSQVNSNLVVAVDNILTSNTGDIDLYTALENAIANNPNFVPTNSNITVNQNADQTTNTESTANSGGNTQDSGTDAMTTGDATSLASALNAVNLNLVGSNTVLTIINILANWNGNIILPDGSQFSTESLINGGANVNVNQSASVATNTGSTASSGGGTQSGGGDQNMTTGSSTSSANSQTLSNIVEVGNGTGYLIINNEGNWSGNLINWGADGTSQSFSPGTYNLLTEYGSSGTGTSGTTNVTSNQTANVNTNVVSSATTGNNSQTGGSTNLTTGNALSLANNFTLANLTSVGGGIFFGIINIFGNWTGNIYSGPKPPDPTPAPVVADVSNDNSSDPPPDSRTPDLTTSIWDSAGAFINPGDTLWVKITTQNNSPFVAHNVEVKGSVVDGQNNVIMPLDWQLGDIPANSHLKISFNLSINKDVKGGLFRITAQSTGQGDSGNTGSSNLAESDFLVSGTDGAVAYTGPIIPGVTNGDGTKIGPLPQVLGASTKESGFNINNYLSYILPTLGTAYFLILGARRSLYGLPLIPLSLTKFFKKRKVAFAGGIFTIIAAIIIFIKKGSVG